VLSIVAPATATIKNVVRLSMYCITRLVLVIDIAMASALAHLTYPSIPAFTPIIYSCLHSWCWGTHTTVEPRYKRNGAPAPAEFVRENISR